MSVSSVKIGTITILSLALFLGGLSEETYAEKKPACNTLIRKITKTAKWSTIAIAAFTGGVAGTAYLTTEPTFAESKNYTESSGLRVVMIGDSLAAPFHLEGNLSNVWRLWTENQRNMFIDTDPSPDSVRSFFEIVSESYPVRAENYARTMAYVNPRYSAIEGTIAHAKSMEGQVNDILNKTNLPDLTLMFIGNNDMDWKEAANQINGASYSRDFIFNRIRRQTLSTYEYQLNRLLEQARLEAEQNDRRIAIVVYGIVNFRSYFVGREIVEREKNQNAQIFPYMEGVYDRAPSYAPQYRDGMIELSEIVTEDLRILVEQMSEQLVREGYSEIRLEFSDSLSHVDLSDPQVLHTADAWHPSTDGHNVLAEALHNGAKEAISFLISRQP